MLSRKVADTWIFNNDIRILNQAVVAGPMEGEGRLGHLFDKIYPDLYMGQNTWEKAEQRMLQDAVDILLSKVGLTYKDIDLFIAGDLLNQNITSSFTARQLAIPLIGVYGACSTAMLSLALGSSLLSGGFISNVITGVSSHNCTSEKQYRYPTEYGGQKTEISQHTVTGAGVSLLGYSDRGPCVTSATIGKVLDFGITNPADMGSAMAPAAVDVIKRHFQDTGRDLDYYDLIITGDLGKVGHSIARDLLIKDGYNISDKFKDCGLMIYADQQQAFSGGSGCASSAIVTYGHLLNEMRLGKIYRMLVVGTGALLSPISYQQGESIPSIAHAVSIEAV